LNGNQIEYIPSSAFASNRHLNFLVLSGNKISEIAGLVDLPNLQYLDLSKNNIESVIVEKSLP
jgi:Leucine-rich repeat (LRR) protein